MLAKSFIPLFLISFISFSTISFAEGTIQQRQITKEEREEYQKLSAVYAQGLFESTCMENYRQFLSEEGMGFLQNAPQEKFDALAKSCRCLVKDVMELYQPQDVITAVTYLYKHRPHAETLSPEFMEFYNSKSGHS